MTQLNIELARQNHGDYRGPVRLWNVWRLACCLSALAICCSCRMIAPIYVWHPPLHKVAGIERIAIAPILPEPELGRKLETAILSQRPAARGDLELASSEQLSQALPIQLVSTAPMNHEQASLASARAVGAQLLLVGEVLQANVDLPQSPAGTRNPSSRRAPSASQSGNSLDGQTQQRLAIFWRLVEVGSGKSLGSHTVAIDSQQAESEYPDLLYIAPNPSERVILASARETWKSLSPYMIKDSVELALPWLQPGSAQVRQGNRWAYQGRWDLAEQQWSDAARRHSWNNAAHLNLALAQVAKEDFSAAKERLGKFGPIGHKRLQAETLFWIDQRHRWYHDAHRLPPPNSGWSFPDPAVAAASVELAHDVPGPNQLPWWTAIPFTKPPGWTWKAWMTQPWIL